VASDSQYAKVLGVLKGIFNNAGMSDEEFETIADEATRMATGVFRPLDAIKSEGYGDNLADLSDALLIGVIVTRYGMVMGYPFAGKE
jgi:hypothetical protein